MTDASAPTDAVALTVFAVLPVRDLAASTDWYGRLFGRPAPDARPAPHVVDYYLAAGRVPEHGTLQLREDADRAGGGLVTINVADLAPLTAALASLGVELATQTFPLDAETVSAVTVGTIEDPDGNAITLVQPHRR
ncbi:VOC family protein [Schumannella luteola]|uniref:Catechol 2,3-dioxygenase-like lactoylglutathione lyase family enzyme n=1 Tax=Schumannella luteola TaxID=472059 RepID=A0A852Y9E3_9MICO|nr:VOC family protein [Schumannella luteola]NYG98482.1 catechol 2,3-dioxygenase-like lactoylglutathione lyase family enzyme [Schumannella luteola]TPX01292.1 VOC family protein [Schumannella luteola]